MFGLCDQCQKCIQFQVFETRKMINHGLNCIGLNCRRNGLILYRAIQTGGDLCEKLSPFLTVMLTKSRIVTRQVNRFCAQY